MGYCYRLLGDIYSKLDESFKDRSVENYQKALEMAERTGMRPLKQYCTDLLTA